jgi:hypothetical protein
VVETGADVVVVVGVMVVVAVVIVEVVVVVAAMVLLVRDCALPYLSAGCGGRGGGGHGCSLGGCGGGGRNGAGSSHLSRGRFRLLCNDGLHWLLHSVRRPCLERPLILPRIRILGPAPIGRHFRSGGGLVLQRRRQALRRV